MFDDVMWVENAQRDHADFLNKLRNRGVEVVELHDLLAQTMAGGTTFAFGVAASADVGTFRGRLLLSVAAVAYAAVTGLTLYASGHVERRVSRQADIPLDRVAGILLTAIAVILLANGFTDLVVAALRR